MASDRFEQWCIVQVMGHAAYGGLVTEFTLGGSAFVRVDVPEVDGRAGFTKLLSPGSIFDITPTTKESALEFVRQHRPRPLANVDLVAARVPALPGFQSPEDIEDFENHDY